MEVSLLGFESGLLDGQQLQAVIQRLRYGRRSFLDSATLADPHDPYKARGDVLNSANVVSAMFPDPKEVLKHSASVGELVGNMSPPTPISRDKHILPLIQYQAQQRSIPYSVLLRFLRAFAIGFSIRQAVAMVPVLLRNNGESFPALFNSKLEESSRWGVFLGSSLGIFESLMLLSAGSSVSVSLRSLLSGVFGGCSLLFLPRESRPAVACFMLARALEVSLMELALKFGLRGHVPPPSPSLSPLLSPSPMTLSRTLASEGEPTSPVLRHVATPRYQLRQAHFYPREEKKRNHSAIQRSLISSSFSHPLPSPFKPKRSSPTVHQPLSTKVKVVRWLYQNWDVLTYCCSSSAIVWAFIFQPDALNPAYCRALNLHCGLPTEAVAAIREMAQTRKWGVSPSTFAFLQQAFSRRGLAPLDPSLPVVGCTVTHAASSSCLVGLLIFLIGASLRSASVLVLSHVLPVLLFRPFDLLFRAKSTLQRVAWATLRSSLSLSLSAAICSSAFLCVISRCRVPNTPLQTAVAGFAAGLPVLLEPSTRRKELALFTFAQALILLSRRGGVMVPGWELFVFSASFAVLMRSFIGHPKRPLLRPNYLGLLAFLFIPNRNTIAPNT